MFYHPKVGNVRLASADLRVTRSCPYASCKRTISAVGREDCVKNARAHMGEHGKRSYNLDGWDGESGLLLASLWYTFDCEQCAADVKWGERKEHTHLTGQDAGMLCRKVAAHMQGHVDNYRIRGFTKPTPDYVEHTIQCKRLLHQYNGD